MASGPYLSCFYDVTAARPKIIPEPAHLRLSRGIFTLDPQTPILFDPNATGASAAASLLSQLTLLPLLNVSSSTLPAPAIFFQFFGTESEGYYVNVSSSSVTLGASSSRGFVWAVQTFRQLFDSGWSPLCYIEDYPRFEWRSLLLDVSHQFFPQSTIIELIHLMSLHKLNILQLHLTDQFWRLSLKSYPQLTLRLVSKYLHSHIAGIIEAGKTYGVEIIPEIQLPSRVHGVLPAFPQLACNRNLSVPTRLCIGSNETLRFVDKMLGEVIQLFESQYISIGGGFEPNHRWHNCAHCRRRMEEEGLSSEADLMSWFVNRIRATAGRYGKTLIVKDFPFHPAVVVSSSQGISGYRSIVSPADADLSAPQFHNEPYQSVSGLVSLRRIYAFEPSGDSLLGVQATLWTEFVADEEQMFSRVFPRAAAFAEVAWTDPGLRDWRRFHDSLAGVHYSRIVQAGGGPAPLEEYPFAQWKAGQLDTDWAPVGWNATAAFPGPGRFVIQFHWVDGSSVEIRNVGVRNQERVWLAVDVHMGIAGPASFRNVYFVKLDNVESECFLHAELRLTSGKMSDGEIYVDSGFG
jgi:hexosaminidase